MTRLIARNSFSIEQHIVHCAEDAVVYHTMLQVSYNMYVQ